MQFLVYQSPEEKLSVQAIVKDDSVWITQKAMAELFGVQRPAITKHLSNIFNDAELDKNVVCSKMELITQHGAIVGKTQATDTMFYNFDVIIAVGY